MESINKMPHLNDYLQGSVLIIEPQWVCRSGLKHLILEQAGYQQVQEAEDLEAASVQLSRLPNVKLIVMELKLPGMNYTESLAAVSAMANKIPILGMSDRLDSRDIHNAICCGAAGFVCKTAGEEELLQAIKTAEHGAIHTSRTQTRGSHSTSEELQSPRAQPSKTHGQDQNQEHCQIHKDAISALTARQREVLEELGQGQSNKEIAEHLKISVCTVKLHVRAILKTLDVKNRTRAALLVQPQQT